MVLRKTLDKLIEKCIWKNLWSGGNKLYKYYSTKSTNAECNSCKGYRPLCASYLSNKEIERRSKEKELNECMRSER